MPKTPEYTGDIPLTSRNDCVMRHENGNCLPMGGFCTAVNNQICAALCQAYKSGLEFGCRSTIEQFLHSTPLIKATKEN